nr:GNAT family N-acetyltransferase [Rhodococcus sp. (in: high G+C Gram-positive bacteria)]
MRFERYGDPVVFRDVIAPVVAAEPARFTTVSSVVHGLIETPEAAVGATMLCGFDAETPVGAVVRMPPRPFNVAVSSDLGDELPFLVGLVDELAGVDDATFAGPRRAMEQLVPLWAAARGFEPEPMTSMMLYRLNVLLQHRSVDGIARRGGIGDIDLLARWFRDFERESIRGIDDPRPDPDAIRARFARGVHLWLWESGGEPVAMAGATAVLGQTARIGPVYVRPERRGRGFGAAVTSAAVKATIARGAREVVLFTDEDYRPSNSVYRSIGFEPVERYLELTAIQRA